MLALNSFISFFADGARTFREAASGSYRNESESIQILWDEMLGKPSSPADDAVKLRNDRLMVGRDVRTSLDRIIRDHGTTIRK